MTIKKKKKLKILLLTIVLFTLGFFLLQWWAKNYVENLLSQKLPSHMALKYSDININIWNGTAKLNDAFLQITNKNTLHYHTSLQLKSLQINGIGYWNLMVNETLSIKNIHLKNPKLNYYPYKKIADEISKTNPQKKGIKTIKFDELTIENGTVNVMKQGTDSIKMSIPSYNFKILGCNINLNSENEEPFMFKDYKLKAEKIILSNNKYETFKVDYLNANKKDWKISNLQIVPKYTKEELSRHLSKERDYISLNIPEVLLENLSLDFFGKRFAISASSVKLGQPKLEVYRDKLLPDDLTIKSLYSKSLRTLNFDLNIKQIKIKSGYISYAELVEPNTKAGKLFFNKVNATLNHLTNQKNAEKTEIIIHSELMGKAPLELNWSFNANNVSDDFDISGSLKNLPAETLNPFFKPNLNALAEGTLQQMYFTFYGNNIASKGEMKMKYDDFEFKILRQNSFKINKVLTAIGNIFIDDGSNTNSNGFRFGEINAERDTTKSFFNYLWINVKSGVVNTLTGNGKK